MRIRWYHMSCLAFLTFTSLVLTMVSLTIDTVPRQPYEVSSQLQVVRRMSNGADQNRFKPTVSNNYQPATNANTNDIWLNPIEEIGPKTTAECNASVIWPKQLVRHKPSIAASCERLFEGDENERKRVRSSMNAWKNSVTDMKFLNKLSSNCSLTRETFSSSFYTSKTELEFPLAYLYLVHYKEGLIQQMIRLMKLHYRPHNVYCVHIDNKSPKWWKRAIRRFTSCLPNVIIPTQNVFIIYATTRILHAHLTCFRELTKSDIKWKYAFNLHSTEIPLATNRELVELAKSMHGKNIVDPGENLSSSNISASSLNKITHRIKWDKKGKLVYSLRSKLRPPFDITLYKSAASANSGLTRDFVKYMLTNKRARFLAKYLRSFPSAVEFFFSTVNHFPDAPGGEPLPNNLKMPLLVKRVWLSQALNSSLCKEQHFIHKLCICSSSDLQWIRTAMERKWFYFLNKYWIGYDHVVMDCIERTLIHQNMDEYTSDCMHL